MNTTRGYGTLAKLVGVMSVLVLAAGPLYGPAFMKLGDIKGESANSSHVDEIEVLSWSWGLSNSGSASTGGGAGKANFQDLSFTKYYDKSSPILARACAAGELIASAEIKLRRRSAGADEPVYLVYKLTDVIVSSYSTGGGADELPTESVSLNFTKIEMTYTPRDSATGQPGEPVSVIIEVPTDVP